MFRTKRIYMDFASATPVHPEAARAVRRGLHAFGNPSAPHEEGRRARALLEEARGRLARTLSVRPETLTVTGSGTEANNLAIRGVVEALIRKGARPAELHVIASAIEHPSVEEPVRALGRAGVGISFIEPRADGVITPDAVCALVRPETVLVSVAAVQSEIGTIQPLRDIAHALEAARAQKTEALFPAAPFPLLHTDASQAPLFMDSAPSHLRAELVTYDAQKVMGPKGVGALYRSATVPLAPFMEGGSQERGVRPGTENVAGALGMARAFELAAHRRSARAERVAAVRDRFISLIHETFPDISVNGTMKRRIANNVNVSVPGASGDYLAVLMDRFGVAVSPRSACIARGAGSKTVASLGKGDEAAEGTLRFSFSPDVSERDLLVALRALKKARAVIDSDSGHGEGGEKR